MRKNILPFILLASVAVVSCNSSQNKNLTPSRDVLIENMDTTVNPAIDFFSYANGGWIKRNPIPESERRWGIANLVQNETYDRMKKLSEDAAANKNAPAGSSEQKIGDFYAAGLDSINIEEKGITPLKAEFDAINAIKDKQGVLDLIAHFQMIGPGALFSPAIYQDEMNSSVMAMHFYQGGIGLPNRDYYFNNDSRTKNIREEYVKHLENMFRLLGDDAAKAKKNSSVIMKIETNLAKASRKLEDLRDPYANYNKMSVADFSKLTPSINWMDLMAKMNVLRVDSVIIGQPEFYKEVENSLKTVSIEDWKTYLRWNLVNAFAGELNSAIDREHFHFYGTVMGGAKEQRPRWKRVLDNEEGYLGDALGQLYVEKYYSPETKKRYQQLTDNTLEAFKERIEKLDWMSKATKEKALLKLASVRKKVGSPDKWRDYSSMKIGRNSYVENAIQGNLWQYNYYVNKLGKPVDREEWDMTPQTYNAYYNPSNNEIVLPAAQFIVPGFPDSLIDDAIIYGYDAASTIGHEITHGFDDEGRQFDANGNLSPWWTSEDSSQFVKRAQLMINQFDNYVVLDSMHLNGKATLGENIADFGGVVIGLDAFKKTQQYKEGKTINGLTPLQRFFLGYALGWLGEIRDASLANQVMTNVHAPGKYRVLGPMSNVPEFYEAFHVKEGDPMYRADSIRVKIW
jgi:putative endopeptidase